MKTPVAVHPLPQGGEGRDFREWVAKMYKLQPLSPKGARAEKITIAALKLRILIPSPPWGRGWLATGAFISRGETGEGVLSLNCAALNSRIPA